MITCFYNAKVLRRHKLVEEDLWIEDGKIVKPRKTVDHKVDIKGNLITPGFIDLQVNGGWGIDLSIEPASINKLASRIPQCGVTAFLPTIVSSQKEKYPELINSLQPNPGGLHGASILGSHLEGPFLNPKYCGAHDTGLLREFGSFASPEDFYGTLERVRMVTLAPELPGALEWIRYLTNRNILVSAGHTEASKALINKAIESGLTMVTHLFNAMAPFHHRHPGIVGETLTNHKLHYSIIADGVHLAPEAIKLAWRSNPIGLFLVSDSMSGLGLPSGKYTLSGKNVEVSHRAAYLTGTQILAGSSAGIDTGVRNLREITGCSIVECLEAASLKPARLLGIYPKKGTLKPGADADLVILDQDLKVVDCYIAGKQWTAL